MAPFFTQTPFKQLVIFHLISGLLLCILLRVRDINSMAPRERACYTLMRTSGSIHIFMEDHRKETCGPALKICTASWASRRRWNWLLPGMKKKAHISGVLSYI